ncbi:NifB/NifX family molybdenum-iron cluster-binding protein [Sporomusa acidovorans]|uniref:Dinitrogenase iron-molybdenum cofactor biosynthesis domain-containing protein n=1 Tax=Sporomusa acidovorans (strain ATCC 49682 / DSM 3132 / Mol) TaxID=1123286 RepID=A0ABZ3J0G3_SPOA4|nr:NifB/NifX family molybdenum-iron cluster-binding protein [Sporomusa acidovorans]OZC14439.1 dinitrogenase iron-molybdenum cofactor [Sporomusa acidovorans DSM 3132]SDF50444.1 Predicted Fe-Mo cluster-binding protein, NifX family [Sporomusa acidovorans]
MKIAITAHGKDLHATVDSRFGRAEYFIIYNQEKASWESIPNTQNLEAAHGAGIQAGQTLAKTGANVLITGHVGPKAFKVVKAANITIYSLGAENGTVEDALAAFLAGKLTPIATPNAIEIKK